MLEAGVDDAMRRGIDEGVMPGGVVVLVRKGEVIVHRAWGSSYLYVSPDHKAREPLPAQTDTIYDLASLTKLFTAVRTMQLVEMGAIELDVPIAMYLPRFAAGGKEGATVRHFLTHTSGFASGHAPWEINGTREERLEAGARSVRGRLARHRLLLF